MSALGFAPTESVAPDVSNGDDGDELDHWWCCDPDVAYCGTDISLATENEIDPDSPLMCVVCLDLELVPCSKCGATS